MAFVDSFRFKNAQDDRERERCTYHPDCLTEIHIMLLSIGTLAPSTKTSFSRPSFRARDEDLKPFFFSPSPCSANHREPWNEPSAPSFAILLQLVVGMIHKQVDTERVATLHIHVASLNGMHTRGSASDIRNKDIILVKVVVALPLDREDN